MYIFAFNLSIHLPKLKKMKTFDVLIEIPKGSRNKYEYDFELKKNSF